MIRNVLFVLGLLTSSLVAQNNVNATIVTYALGAPQGGFKAFFRNGGEIKPFAANVSALSPPIAYQGPRRFEIRATEEAFAAPPAGQQAPAPLAVVDLPENVNYILLLAADAGGGRIRLLAYDISPEALKGGDYKVFNFSRSIVEMNLGKKKLTLRPAQNDMLTDPSFHSPDTKVMELIIHKYDGAVRNNQPVKRSLWEHWHTKRIVMFLFDGKHKGEALGIMSLSVEPPPRNQNQPANAAANP